MSRYCNGEQVKMVWSIWFSVRHNHESDSIFSNSFSLIFLPVHLFSRASIFPLSEWSPLASTWNSSFVCSLIDIEVGEFASCFWVQDKYFSYSFQEKRIWQLELDGKCSGKSFFEVLISRGCWILPFLLL